MKTISAPRHDTLPLNVPRIMKISRLGKDQYALHGMSEGEPHTICIKVADLDLVEFAEMLGFGQFYDLDVHLDGIEHWTGDCLVWGG